MVAVAILLVGIVGVMSLFTVAAGQNKSQGEIATRTTEYCQDKMEQLLALSFADGATNTTVYPPQTSGGTGLGGNMAVNTTVGGTDPASRVSGYLDYLDANGNLLTSSAGAFYVRLWSISTDSTGTLKTITVRTEAASAAGAGGMAPATTLVCIKSSFL